MQSDPLSKSGPSCEDVCPAFQCNMNCFLESNGMHHFESDLKFGSALMRMRNGKRTKEDIDCMNTRVFTGADNELPKDLRCATHKNSDGDAINAALFEKRHRKTIELHQNAEDCSLTFSDNVCVRMSLRMQIAQKTNSFLELMFRE